MDQVAALQMSLEQWDDLPGGHTEQAPACSNAGANCPPATECRTDFQTLQTVLKSETLSDGIRQAVFGDCRRLPA